MLLLRHAGAGERLSSPHIDRFRELDEAGRADARQFIWTLAEQEIERIVSSPLARCVQSVIPIAESRRLVVERRDELLPDAEVDATLELLAKLPDATLVCTHREVIMQLFEGELDVSEGRGVGDRASRLALEPDRVCPSAELGGRGLPARRARPLAGGEKHSVTCGRRPEF